MTPYTEIYNAFLSKIEEDEWSDPDDYESALADWRSILESAIPFFEYPKTSLSRDEDGFNNNLSDLEIQILSYLMKQEWLDRTISTWENIKPLYEERDYSPANMLDKFIKLLDRTEQKIEKLKKRYYRSRVDADGKRKPFDYSRLAGGDIQ